MELEPSGCCRGLYENGTSFVGHHDTFYDISKEGTARSRVHFAVVAVAHILLCDCSTALYDASKLVIFLTIGVLVSFAVCVRRLRSTMPICYIVCCV